MIGSIFRLPAATVAGIMLLTAWSSVTTPALAQGSPRCAPDGQFAPVLSSRYGEHLTYEMVLTDGRGGRIYVNPETGTFTFTVVIDTMECVGTVGQDFKPAGEGV